MKLFISEDNYNKLRTIVDPDTGLKPEPEIINERKKLLDDEVKFGTIKRTALEEMRNQGMDEHLLTDDMIVNTVCGNSLPTEGTNLEEYTKRLVQSLNIQHGGSMNIKKKQED